MLISFFQSFKYVGHLYPIAFLRIYIGYVFLSSAIDRIGAEFLTQPRLAASIVEALPLSAAPEWYSDLVQQFVLPNWQFFAYFLTYCEFIIGISFLVGFLVRPTAILGILVSVNMIYFDSLNPAQFHQLYVALFVILLWIGAGRCLGLDYFFYKRQRGLWW